MLPILYHNARRLCSLRKEKSTQIFRIRLLEIGANFITEKLPQPIAFPRKLWYNMKVYETGFQSYPLRRENQSGALCTADSECGGKERKNKT